MAPQNASQHPAPVGFPPLPTAPAAPRSRPCRVCIASFDFVGPVKNGGVGTAFTSLGEALASAGHEVTLLFLAGDWCENRTMAHWIDSYRAKGIRFIPMPPQISTHVDAPFHVLKSYEAYLWLRSQPAFDVVHFSEWKGPGYFSLLAKHQGLAFEKTVLCVHTHGPTLWHKLSNGEYVRQLDDLEMDFVERESTRRADVLVSPSQYLLRWMSDHAWTLPANCHVQPYARPATTLKPLPAAGSSPSPVRELVFFGRLEVRKGLVLFCDALDQLAAHPAATPPQVTFLGKVDKVNGQDAADYVRQRAARWPWKPTFISDRDQQGAMDYLKGGPRLAVLPSLADNLPNTVLECLGARIPFIASDAGGIPEMIAAPDLAATCFPLRASALAARLRHALDHGVKPASPAVDPASNDAAWVTWHHGLALGNEPGLSGLSVTLESTQPLVSICMSHWNRPAYLRQALDSIEAQDYPNFEVVLVDDGSTDPEALALIDELEPTFRRRGWQLLRNPENRYPGAARNRAVQHARGEYVLLMDDDNCAKPNEVSTLVRVAQRTGADILTCFLDVFGGTEAPTASLAPKSRTLFLGAATSAGAFKNWFGDTNSLMRRETFLSLGGFHEEWGVGHEDWELLARAALRGCHLEVVPEPLAWYRLNSAEASVNRRTPVQANHLRNVRPYLEAVPTALREFVLFAQGQFIEPAGTAAAPESQPYVIHSARWRGLFEAARVLLKLKRPAEAVNLLLDALKAAEVSQHPGVILEALLDIGEAMAPLDKSRAHQILKLARELATNLRRPAAQERVSRLLGEAPAPAPAPAKPSQPATPPPPRHVPAPQHAAPATPRSAPNGTASPLVSIIIPVWNNLPLTQRCLAALEAHTTDVAHEIVVVDNGSTDGSRDFLATQQAMGRLRLLSNAQNLGFARASNQGALAARAPHLLFLNNDTEPQAGWLAPMLAAAREPGMGVVGAKLLYPDGRIQHAGVEFINGVPDHPFRHAPANAPEANQRRDLDMVTGACMLIARDLFLELAGFDEAYRNGVEDVDLCLRVRTAGRRVRYEPTAVVIHHEGSTPGRFDHVTPNLQRFFARWKERLDARNRLVCPTPEAIIRSEQGLLTLTLDLAWEGSFLDFGSLSHVNRSLVQSLDDCRDLHLTLVGTSTQLNGKARFPELAGLASRLKPSAPPQTRVTIRHAWPPDWSRPAHGRLAVIQPWEYGSLPRDWVRHAAHVDEFWVPSSFVRQCYLDSGIPAEKVHVVPNGIDPARFHPGAPPRPLPTTKRFKLLFVGGTIRRKGPDILLRTYLETFTAADDVCLVIKDFGGQSVYAGQTLAAQIAAARQLPNAPEILHLDEEWAPEDLPGLYTACDCLVHPYRGEGFGLPVLEAMACGLPVIVTAGGATDDFTTADTALHLPARRATLGTRLGDLELVRPGWWLEPDASALAQQMRWVVQHPAEARALGQRASRHAHDHWTWRSAAQRLAERARILGGATTESSQPPHTPAVGTPPRTHETRASRIVALPDCARLGHLGAAHDALAKGDLRAAWRAACQATDERPFHPEAALLLGEIAQQAGDIANARLCIQKACDLAPDWKPARRRLKKLQRAGQHARSGWLVLPAAVAPRPAHQRPRITVCLIVRNEEAFLTRCLESIRPVAHQIVVVDTGSTDRTVEIARSFGAEVHSFPWCDDFSAARNAALEHARGDWILSIDADEELPAEEHGRLWQALQKEQVLGYRLPLINVGREAEGVAYVPRLFRNAPGLFYVSRVHEQVFSSVLARAEEWGMDIALGASQLRHHGYSRELVHDRNKGERNLRLLGLALEEFPEDANLRMNLGLELIRAGDTDAGLEQYKAAFRALSSLPSRQVMPELRETLLTQYSSHLMKAQKLEETIAVLQSPLATAGGLTASLQFTLGLALMRTQRFQAAAEAMRQCLATRKNPALSPINPEIHKAGPHHCLATCLAQLGRADAAREALVAALHDDPESASVRMDLARLHARENRPLDALAQLNEIVGKHGADPEPWRLGAHIALSGPEFVEFALDWTGEALKFHPADPRLTAARVEALLRAGDAVGALACWKQAGISAVDARTAAALRFCELVSGQTPAGIPPAAEPEVSREFLLLYRQLIPTPASALLPEVNTRIQTLARTLPTAASQLEAALAEAA